MKKLPDIQWQLENKYNDQKDCIGEVMVDLNVSQMENI